MDSSYLFDSDNDEEKLNSPSLNEKLPNLKYSLRGVATYQLISSVTLFLLIFHTSTLMIGFVSISIFLFIIFLDLVTLLSAILIYRRKQLGLFIGLFTSALQTLFIHFNGFIFYDAGFPFMYFNVGSFTGFSMGIMPSIKMTFGEHTDLSYVGINIIAVIATYLIYKASTYWDDYGEFPQHMY